MTDDRGLRELLAEFERVGVDPNTVSAGIAVPTVDAIRILRSLPDGAGPAAFLARLRENAQGRVAPAAHKAAS
jgi:hypothetical protein